jgi:hypothetical protein
MRFLTAVGARLICDQMPAADDNDTHACRGGVDTQPSDK